MSRRLLQWLVAAVWYSNLHEPGSDTASLVGDYKAGLCAVSSLHHLTACATGAVLLVVELCQAACQSRK
jgi:hypothetical protein